jgi:hypothetical protein
MVPSIFSTSFFKLVIGERVRGEEETPPFSPVTWSSRYNARGLLFILTVLTCLLGYASAQPFGDPYRVAPRNASRPVLLKLNANYLLFAYPVAPYQDRNGSVMVPLRVVGELMGGQVYISKPRKAGILIRPTLEESHLLEFVADSQQAYIDERAVQLASAPVWLEEVSELLVPLEPMIAAFNLKPRWNRSANILELDSILFEFLSSFELETLPDGYEDTAQLVPNNIALTRQGPGARQIRLSMNLQNLSKPPVQAGQQGIFLLAQYGGVGGTIVIGHNTGVATIGPSPTDPCRKEGRGFVCNAVFPAFDQAIYNTISGSYPLDYLIARVRVRVPPTDE